MREGKFGFIDLLYRFRSIIPRNKPKFMTHELEFKRAGCFRLRPKVHKPVLGSRPVSNLRKRWVQRPCGWLCCVLQPIQQACDSITASSEQFLQSYTAIKLDGNAETENPWVVACWDIEELYPSIQHQHCNHHCAVTVESYGI